MPELPLFTLQKPQNLKIGQICAFSDFFAQKDEPFAPISSLLRDTLHWLPVTQRIDYKIALMTYSCVHSTSPAYFNGICRPVASVEGRVMLRSANYREFVEPRMRGKRYGPRSFHVAAHSIRAQKCVYVFQFHVLHYRQVSKRL